PLRGEARIRSSPSTRGRGAPPPALRATSPLGGEDIGCGAGYPPRFCGEARIKSRPNTAREGAHSGSAHPLRRFAPPPHEVGRILLRRQVSSRGRGRILLPGTPLRRFAPPPRAAGRILS